jgi:hypothetical protein
MKTIICILYIFFTPDSLVNMIRTDPAEALILAKQYEQDTAMRNTVFTIYTTCGGAPEWEYVYKTFTDNPPEEQFKLSERFGDLVAHIKNAAFARQGIAALKQLEKTYNKEGKITTILALIHQVRTDRISGFH